MTKATKPAAKDPERLILVDGSGFIFRAYHALPPLTRSDGTPSGAVAGFSNMLLKLIEDAEDAGRPSHLAVIFDTARKSFRNDIYPEYKAHRPDPPEDLRPQFPLVRDAVRAFNLPAIELAGFEADDIIATYARLGREAGMDVTVVTGDKDLMQLMRLGVKVVDPLKNRVLTEDDVKAKFGVGPELLADALALAGDSSDNVPGVPGIGFKTAAELLTTYGDLESVLARASEIKQPKRRESLLANAELARISRRLVTLDDHVKLPLGLHDLDYKKIEPAKLLAFLTTMEFRRLAERVAARAGNGAAIMAAPGSIAAPAAGEMRRREAAPAPDPKSYALVTDLKDLEDWIARAHLAGRVAFDTETNSLDAVQAKLVGFSLALAPGQACYVPLAHVAPGGGDGLLAAPAPKQVPLEHALALLKPLLEDDAVLKIGHNIKYDAVVMNGLGIDLAPVDDSMLMSYVLSGGVHGHGMDELSELLLGHKPIAFGEVAGSGKAAVTFDRVPLDKACAYAAEDADVTLRLAGQLKPRLREEGLLAVYETLERPLIPVIRDMERAGIKVDRGLLASLSADFGQRLVALERDIHKLAGTEFNVASPKQLGEILFDKLGLPGGRKGKTGAYATPADLLEELAGQGHALPARVLDYRQLAKLKGTYTDALQQQIDPKTGRVHTSYAMASAATGRLASTDPNLQNIPIRTEEGRKLRRCFIAEPGHVLVSADYSQIELRVLAAMADIPALKEALKRGADIHAQTAAEVFGTALDKVTPEMRRGAKSINFGIIYGMSAFGLAAQLGIPQREAQAFIDKYFAAYPGIRAYMDRVKREAHAKGHVVTLFGRRVWLPTINDKNPARRNFGERAAINAPIQGSAADIIKRAMIRIPGALAAAGLKSRMLLQVHDELVFEAPAKEVERLTKLVKGVMEGAAGLSVPLTVETGAGANWDEAH
ncbi:MAG: DNA polymerase I [Alphaproteobacteria bacterium]|nr:DNA polymerase I [Alphaproteobacteria bacterium]